MWDLIVLGGGSAGVATAVAAARKGCSTLLIEKMNFLGGQATGGLVTPMMKNFCNDENLTNGLYTEILERLKKNGNSIVYEDGNPGWFNPVYMKCLLDDICVESGVNLLFDTILTDIKSEGENLVAVTCNTHSGPTNYLAKYFVDATGDAALSTLAGVPFRAGTSEEVITSTGQISQDTDFQALSLRFIMANVDIYAFTGWIREIDPETEMSSFYNTSDDQLMFSTAHVTDQCEWDLSSYFKQGMREGIIDEFDASYFQIFAIPGQKNSIAFNCPRINFYKSLNPLDSNDTTQAQLIGRRQIRRLAKFLKKFFVGFEDSYISEIAPVLGVRESRRVLGKYTLTEEDIRSNKKFPNCAAKSTYPIDIHSQSDKIDDELGTTKIHDYYEIPLECMLNDKVNNLLSVGRCISSTFKAQSSLRIQPNCWQMGEYAGNYIAEKIKG